MSRWRIAGLLCLLTAAASLPAVAQTATPTEQDTGSPYGLPPPFKPKADAPVDKSQMPPEEDKVDAPRTYSFNPVQSKSEVLIGDQYFKKGNYTAAVSRYDEATKWNDGNSEAWLRLGEAQEKKFNKKAAREAYQKYLELAPDAKNAKEIKERLAKLNR